MGNTSATIQNGFICRARLPQLVNNPRPPSRPPIQPMNSVAASFVFTAGLTHSRWEQSRNTSTLPAPRNMTSPVCGKPVRKDGERQALSMQWWLRDCFASQSRRSASHRRHTRKSTTSPASGRFSCLNNRPAIGNPARTVMKLRRFIGFSLSAPPYQ